jgi:flagellum-specific peptidoglycan hydrolase FlgJ
MIYLAKLLYGFAKISTSVIYVQAYHETGNFKSKIFKENSNLFGMRKPSKRKTFATGSQNGHAVFKSHWDSIRDYFERQKNFRINSVGDEEYMISTVASGYAEDKNYLSKWKNLNISVKSPVDNLYFAFIFFFFFISVLIWFGTISNNKNNNSKFK